MIQSQSYIVGTVYTRPLMRNNSNAHHHSTIVGLSLTLGIKTKYILRRIKEVCVHHALDNALI